MKPPEIDYEMLKKLPVNVRGEIITSITSKPHTRSEIARMGIYLEAFYRANAKKRRLAGKKLQGNLPEGQVRDLIGALFGLSGKIYERAKFVVQSGWKEYIDHMNITGKVTPTFLALQQRKNGERLTKQAQEFKGDRIQIFEGDFREVCKKIKDESVDAVICDPPYLKKFLHLWEPLGEVSKRVLKPGGYLITYTGVMYLNEVMDVLSKNLTYFWEIAVLHSLSPRAHRTNAVSRHKDILLFYKPPYRRPCRQFQDVIKSPAPEKSLHPWQQPENELRELVDILTLPGDLVLDPFCGSGTIPVLVRK